MGGGEVGQEVVSPFHPQEMPLPLVNVKEGRAPENGEEADAVGAPPLAMWGLTIQGHWTLPAPVRPVTAPLPMGFLPNLEGSAPKCPAAGGAVELILPGSSLP